MAKVVVKSKVKKVKRKFPVEVRAPESLNSVSLGRVQTSDLSKFVGKSIKMNLMYVTKSAKNQNVRVTFRVTEVNSGVAKSELVSYEHISYYLNRFVKSGSDLVADSFVCVSKDGKNVRVKPFVVTKMNASASVLASIRDKVKELIVLEVSKISAEEFIVGVTNNKFQLALRNEAKKIFPLKALEFKMVVIE